MAPKRNFGVPSFIWILMLLLYQVLESHGSDGYTLLPSYDVCNPDTPGAFPPTAYLGDVNASTEIYVNWPAVNHTVHHNCLMLFRSCASCQIRVEPATSFSYPVCHSSDLSHIYNGACAKGCIYFQIFDADYQSQTSLIFSKSIQLRAFSSQSRQLHVVACGEGIYNTNVAMRLRLSVKKKETIFRLHQWSGSQVFSSPYFPDAYTLNEEEYKYEFIAGNSARFSVMFSDWLISPYSYVRFYNANIVNRISGAMSRPYIVSTGPNLTMVFNTGPMRNTGIRFGFRAVARYYASQDSTPKVFTDCDKYVTTPGGTLRLSHLANDGKLRDCIWIITKPAGYERVHINISRLRLKYGGDEKIEIMDGFTSRGPRKLYADGAVLNSGGGEKSTFESMKGFYIRLKGRFDDPDALVISYSSYYYGCSPYPPAFLCDNKYCIAEFLKCDGYDHCGDNSDEASHICGYHENDTERNTSSHSVSVGVIIPIVVSVVLVIAMCLVIIFVRRCRKLSNETYGSAHSGRRQGNSRGHHRRRRGRNVQMSVTVSSGEHPPSYSEVMQTTPIGQLNMAFSWSGAGSALTQPPSYEEAVGSNSSELLAADVEQTLNAEALTGSHEGRNERAIDVGPSEAFNSLLAPNSYVSSSSSSEDLSEAHMDTSSSDSSLDNNNSFTSHRRDSECRRPTTQDLIVNEDNDIIKKEEKTVALVDSDVDIVLSPSSALKMSKNHDTNKSRYQEEDSHKDNQQEERGIQETDRRENKRNETGYSSHVDNKRRKTTAEDNSEEVTQALGQLAEERVRPKYAISFGENERDNSNERVDPRHRNDAMECIGPKRMYHDRENNGQYRSTEAVERDRDDWRGSYTSSANHRSRSLADLSYGPSRGFTLVPGPDHGLSETDKRFSYAGTGDTTFRNGRRDPYTTGTLVRDNPVESLHHFLPQRENRPRENSASATPYSRSDKTHVSHDNNNSNNLQGSQLLSENAVASSLDAVPEMKWEEEDPRNYRTHRPKTYQQQDQTYRYGKPSNYKPREKYPSASSSRDTGHGYRHSGEPSGFNGNSAESPPRRPNRGYEEKDYSDYHSTRHSLERTRPYPSNKDISNQTDREQSSNASSEDRGPRPPRPSVRRNRQRSHSSALVTEQPSRHPANSNDETRPRPAPRRSVINSTNANSNEHVPPRGVEFQSTSAPLTVINYVAATESGHGEDSDGNQASPYPLAQLVFKTTNDDVFI